jgi:hypothetical protein
MAIITAKTYTAELANAKLTGQGEDIHSFNAITLMYAMAVHEKGQTTGLN